MRMKHLKDVTNMIADIYKVGPLTYPEVFQCDNGSEFKAGLTKLLEKHGMTIWFVTTKYQHNHMTFIEALNKPLMGQLFKVQDAQVLNDPKKVSSTWVKHLYELVNQLNDMEMQMIRMKPKDAIKLKEVILVKTFPSGDTLPDNGLYH